MKTITDKQKDRIPEVIKKYKALQAATDQNLNKKEVVYWINKVYETMNMKPPKTLYITKSPREAVYLIARKTGETVEKVIKEIAWCYGNHELEWLKFYDFHFRVCGLQECEAVVPLLELAKLIGFWAPFKNEVVICRKPVKYVIDDQWRPHCDNAPAIVYSDGFKIWAIHGKLIKNK